MFDKTFTQTTEDNASGATGYKCPDRLVRIGDSICSLWGVRAICVGFEDLDPKKPVVALKYFEWAGVPFDQHFIKFPTEAMAVLAFETLAQELLPNAPHERESHAES